MSWEGTTKKQGDPWPYRRYNQSNANPNAANDYEILNMFNKA